MTTTPEARILAELKKHGGLRNRGMGWRCYCGTDVSPEPDELARHQAAVIATLSDIELVLLPQPDEGGDWCSGRSRNAVWINEDNLIEDRFGLGQDPADVRAWAADLLAAAREAEARQ